MRLKLTLFVLSCFFLQNLHAQWSVGPRFGGASGISLKNYSKSGYSHFEVITAFNFDENIEGFSATLLYEKFGSFNDAKTFGAILGVGETMVFGDDFLLGLSGIIGFDMRLGRRISFQVDWLPTWIIVNDNYFSAVNIAGTVRWIFGGRVTPAY